MYGWGMGQVANPVCTGTFSWLDPGCWGVWIGAQMTGQANAAGNLDTSSSYSGFPLPPAPLPPPAPVATAENPTPLTTPPSSAAEAQNTINATLAAGTAANQQQYQQFFATVPTGCQSTILPSFGFCDTTIYWAAGITVLLGFVYMAGGRW